MKTTTLVGRTSALALGLVCLFALATPRAQANGNVCPDCPSLVADISFDFVEDEFDLTIEEFTGFDYAGADSVELLIEEGTTQEWIAVTFVLDDIENGVIEIGDLPTSITGSGTEVYLRVYDSGTNDEVFVAVRVM